MQDTVGNRVVAWQVDCRRTCTYRPCTYEPALLQVPAASAALRV